MSWRRHRERGLTLIETTLVLVATAVLVAALTPAAAAALTDARIAAATTYATSLATAINNFVTDNGFPEFKVDGDGKGGDDVVRMLVSDGDIPDQCNVSLTDGCGAPTTGFLPEKSWLRPVQPDSDGATVFTYVDFFDRHLVMDMPGNHINNQYVTSWRGSYINGPISADPWGNRYMFSAQNMNLFPQTSNVLSAGPDEAIDTTWDTATMNANGDDIVVFVR